MTYNGFVFIAGQVADNRQGTLESQTREVLAKIEALLAKAGSDKSRLLAVDVFLPAIGDFDAMNRVYDAWVDPANPPARALRRGPPGRSRPARGNDRHRRAALSAAPSTPRAPPGGSSPLCTPACFTRSISTPTAGAQLPGHAVFGGPFPYYQIKTPVCRIRNGQGPRVLLMAGNHGDEYEGEIALGRLIRRLDPARVRARSRSCPWPTCRP